MKKALLITSLLLPLSLAASTMHSAKDTNSNPINDPTPQTTVESANDTTFLYKGKRIVVDDSKELLSVKAYQQDGDTLQCCYEGNFNNGRTTEHWEVMENFSIPFLGVFQRKSKGQSQSTSSHFKSHWAGIVFGFNNAVNTKSGGLNGANGVENNYGHSYEIAWNISDTHISLPHPNLGIVLGFGLDWRNYRMDDNSRFVKEGGKLSVTSYPDGCTPKFSRLKTLDITFPILLEWQTLSSHRKVYASVGPVINFKVYSSILTRYTDANGQAYKEFKKGVYQNPVNADLQAMIGCRNIALYAKYSLFPLLQTSKAPEMHGFSTGIMWVF